jgi:hypothetical protein
MGRRPERPWLQHEIADLFHMRDVQKFAFERIDVALGRPGGSSYYKYHKLKKGKEPTSGPTGPGGRIQLSPAQIAARAAREHAASRMTPTAVFFGDPPPGYSALDRRQA